ncbi:uncharacterized protein L969DRAFT_292552 [Mixia osmundae IAM 14324]|uniref:NADH-ubiquinone oxidoreductase 9.5 kDa subunit n=1 Tax=Mixia osmundae (strain CBS 9802 / IAM 14324 / JCM 22182 / KY 12970) TaxID=764103 RepID=G7DXI1_MIXOS|nr:uncharacterized protein L969DRAFT_292552 [Mixia osmundae IAM 14324]KEI41215.1 hypothetical protein L969DRAFT_292552 [Mixia osmundae IAM 14324]GAA95291.1 hypothetical protein E5Q_01947 [Mixia osmundae IAM 14324]
MASTLFGPFARTYRSLQRNAHENPAIFYSIIIGAVGPIAVLTVPPIRRTYFGYQTPDRVPTSYPLPRRPRDESLSGYDDE